MLLIIKLHFQSAQLLRCQDSDTAVSSPNRAAALLEKVARGIGSTEQFASLGTDLLEHASTWRSSKPSVSSAPATSQTVSSAPQTPQELLNLSQAPAPPVAPLVAAAAVAEQVGLLEKALQAAAEAASAEPLGETAPEQVSHMHDADL